MATIQLTNSEDKYEIRSGMDLLTAYQINPFLPFKFGCCHGSCGVCVIQILEGHENLSLLTKEEEFTLQKKGLKSPPYRLACQCAIHGNILLKK
jgi:ferredoxin